MSKKLFIEFPPVTAGQWKAKIEGDLKGKPFSKLQRYSRDGLPLTLYMRQEDQGVEKQGIDSLPGAFPYRRGNSFNAMDRGWQIVQEVSVDSPKAAQDRLQEAFEAEVPACKLYSWEGNAFGQSFLSAIEAVDLRYKALHLFVSQDLETVLIGLNNQLQRLEIDPAHLTGTLSSLETDLGRLDIDKVLKLTRQSPHFRALGIDLSTVDENGGSLVQQLAFGLARAVDWMSTEGISAEEVAANLAFTFPTGGEFLLEVAKLRAFRMLIGRVMEVMDIKDPHLQSPFIISQGARWNKSRYDLHNNLLRTTTEAASAVMGGAHAVVVPAFDKLLQPEDSFSARMARNIQHILRSESYLDQVADPAGGSYYLEYLTDTLAEEAWKLFQQIEAEGGYQVCLQSNRISEWLMESFLKKQSALAKRKQVFVGINNYPNPAEVRQDIADISGDEGPAEFERLRLKADKWAKEQGKRPQIGILMFGDIRMRNARAQFSRNLLACGGFEMVDSLQPDNWEASLKAMADQQVGGVVLCASDDDYQADKVAALRSAIPNVVTIIAGKASKDLEADHFIHLGVNAIEVIQELQQKLLH